MTGFDYLVLGVIAASVLLSLFRGLVLEVLSVLSWVVGIVVANRSSAGVAANLPVLEQAPAARVLLAYVLVFVGTLIACGIVAFFLSRTIRALGLGIADRTLGALFGLLRGLLIVLTCVLLGGLTAMPRMPFWREAVLAPPLESAIMLVKPWLPRSLAERIRYR